MERVLEPIAGAHGAVGPRARPTPGDESAVGNETVTVGFDLLDVALQRRGDLRGAELHADDTRGLEDGAERGVESDQLTFDQGLEPKRNRRQLEGRGDGPSIAAPLDPSPLDPFVHEADEEERIALAGLQQGVREGLAPGRNLVLSEASAR